MAFVMAFRVFILNNASCMAAVVVIQYSKCCIHVDQECGSWRGG